MNDTAVRQAVNDARRAAANMIAENGWTIPATYELFVEMIAAAYATGQHEQLAKVVQELSAA